MARSFDSDKVIAWRRRVGRFSGSGMTVVGFCGQEGVSTASFYRWRGRLAEMRRGKRKAARATGKAAAFQPVRVTRADLPVSIQLPGGVRIEVPAENLDAVRAVVSELLRQDATPDRGGLRC